MATRRKDRGQWSVIVAAAAAAGAEQFELWNARAESPTEGMPEVAVERGVNERIEGRIQVAYPEQYRDEDRRRLAGVAAQRHRQIEREERQPTAQESTKYDAKGLSGLVLSAHLAPLVALLALVVRRGADARAMRPVSVSGGTRRDAIETISGRVARQRERLNELGLTLGGLVDALIGEDHD